MATGGILWIALLLVVCYGNNDTSKLKHVGVNVVGAEFGDQPNHRLRVSPGVHGRDYIYPEPGGSAAYFARQGMNTFRLPIRWERIQTRRGGALNAGEQGRLIRAIEHLTNFVGGYAIIDIHNYGRYDGNIIAESFVTREEFVSLWTQLARLFRNNDRVMFGIMNEPYEQQLDIWIETLNVVIAAIRETGAKNTVLVPGIRFTGAWSWTTVADRFGGTNAQEMGKVVDPEDNLMYEIHHYYDSDYSGKSSTCVSPTHGSETLAAVTQWLRDNGFTGFLGEFGVGSSSTCISALKNTLAFLEENNDVWAGWTYWAAGPWFRNEFFSIERGKATKQFSAMRPFLNEPLDVPSSSSSSGGLAVQYIAIIAVAGVVGLGLGYVAFCKKSETKPTSTRRRKKKRHGQHHRQRSTRQYA